MARLSRRELASNLALSIEKERVKMNITQEEMAYRLGMSTSGYKKMISGETAKIDTYVLYLLHEMTGKYGYELCGSDEREFCFVGRLRDLDTNQLRLVRSIVETFLGIKAFDGRR